jgi:FKBP-type peptidyl-prolyl cis-trans isomerase
MNKLFLIFAVVSVVFVSCKTETATCTAIAKNTSVPTSEKDSIQRYLNANNLTATRDTSGVFYSISTPGTGATTPEVCSFVTTRYNGKTFKGEHIDSTLGTATYTGQLSSFIEGWEKGIPKVKAGGKITLYIPPTLAYGNGVRDANNNVVIAPNTYMKFVVDVISVQ